MKHERHRFSEIFQAPASTAAAILRLLVLLVVAAACGTDVLETGDGWMVFVQVPRDATKSGDWRDPYPEGSRVVAWKADETERGPRLLSPGFAAAGAPAVSHDGRRVLFAAKSEPSSPWAIYETRLEGGAARRVSSTDGNCLWPAYLPAERIVFASDRAGELDPADGGKSFSLYTCRLDGSSLTRVTFSPGSEIDPAVLADGRILYVSRQPAGLDRAEGAWALFTIRNDGTGLAPFYGSHTGPYWKRRPRELGDGRIAFGAAEAGGGDAWVESVRLARPLNSRERLERGGSWLSTGPWSEGAWIASHRPRGASSFGIYRVDSQDEPPRPLFDYPGFDEIEPVRACASAVPRGHVTAVRDQVTTGTLLGLDARRTDRTPDGEALLSADRVRIFRALPASFEASTGRYPLGPPEELIADLALADDGSFLAEVPADTPLRFETFDAEGRSLLDSRGWVWVRPGERRSCIGCHENRESAPPNRVPEVLAPRRPMTMEALRGESQ